MSSKMTFYILKRILLAILTVWIVITVTFFVMHSVPGGPFVGEKAISKEAQAALEAKYGLDKPLMEQYVTYLKDIVTRFDFGPSLKQRGRQVIDIIADGMRTSAKLGVIAAVIATVTGIVLGALAAIKRSRQMMKGNKWRAFVLDLSFILWYLLSFLTLGIVHFFYVRPYVQATNGELYQALKAGNGPDADPFYDSEPETYDDPTPDAAPAPYAEPAPSDAPASYAEPAPYSEPAPSSEPAPYADPWASSAADPAPDTFEGSPEE